ncbi:MAG: hypothetical protein EOO33_08120 [Comamonadaceae bacterium]|nr:MAG: hypothetical protein EOO33_08120 [Comamonadaceae bacterium]
MRRRRVAVWCGMAAAVLGTAGCTDGGYPSTDHPVLDPFSMTQNQRLAAMNQVGGSAHAGYQWSYALLPGCTLRIDLDGDKGPMPSVDIPLMGAVIDFSNDRTQRTFGVQVAPTFPTPGLWQPVLHSRNWADVSWMQLLLRVMQKSCNDASPSARNASTALRSAPHTPTN